MRIPLLIRGRAERASSAERLLRFRKLLHSARRSSFYSPTLEHVGLNSSRAIRAIKSVEQTLPNLPVTSYLPRRHRRRAISPPAVLNPLPGANHIQLATDPEQATVEILAGSLAALLALTGRTVVTRALVVLSGSDSGCITSQDRDALWAAFRVPIFEQHTAPDGQPIAHECEAHNGLHLLEGNAVLEVSETGELLLTSLTDLIHPAIRLKTGYSARLQLAPCGCGVDTPRIFDLKKTRLDLR